MKTEIKGEYSPTSLPAKHKINDYVDVDFLDAGKIQDCVVRSIRFAPGKVKYDLAVLTVKDTEQDDSIPKFTSLKNVDSAFIVESHKQTVIRLAEEQGFVNVKGDLINVCYEKATSYLNSLSPAQEVI